MYDPKQIVTPDAFQVDSELLGTPLATPKRRFAAILVDLLIASVFSLLGMFFLAVGLGILCFKLAYDKATHNEDGKMKRDLKNGSRFAFAAGGAALLFFIAYGAINDPSSETQSENKTSVSNAIVNYKLQELADEAKEADYGESTPDKWEAIAAELEKDILTSMMTATSKPAEDHPVPENAPELLHQYEIAIEASDSATVDSLQPLIATFAAADKIAELEAQNEQYIETIVGLQNRNEELKSIAENPGIIRILKTAANDLGLAFGWIGLYFIVGLVWGKGQTPGKKLFSLKVIRLNGERITYWKALERFGGYAAGLATGLVGFFQVYWDANRQAIQDKIAETAVVDQRDKRRKKYQHLSKGIE